MSAGRPEHVIVKFTGHRAPGYYVTRRPEPVDRPMRAEYGVQLLVEVDGPFGTYDQAVGYIDEVTERMQALNKASRDR